MGEKKRGRPPADRPTNSSVTTWLPVDDHDRLIQIAEREDKSISALVRELVALKIRKGENRA